MFDIVGNVNEKILGREADLAPFSGHLAIKPEKSEYVLTLTDTDDPSRILDEKRVPAAVQFMPGIEDGCEVRAGDQITTGFVNFRNRRQLTDIESTMHTFVENVKEVYNRPAGDLTEADIEGKADHLLDLKSNVIVGKKIPAGTGLKPYAKAGMPYRTEEGYVPVDNPSSPHAKVLPEWAPEELKELDTVLPQQLDFGGGDFSADGGHITRNGRTISAEDARLYLFDDLGVSQRWTNKFSEVGIEVVGDLVGKSEEDLLRIDGIGAKAIEELLVGKSEEDLLRIDGIGAKAIEELRDGLEEHNLLYILENTEDVADEEDLSQLLQMVFSPDGPDDILLGTSAPRHHLDTDEEMIGAPAQSKDGNGIINEDMASLDELLNKLVDTDEVYPEEQED